jgi:DNA-binding NarL/FixJ family response regulator
MYIIIIDDNELLKAYIKRQLANFSQLEEASSIDDLVNIPNFIRADIIIINSTNKYNKIEDKIRKLLWKYSFLKVLIITQNDERSYSYNLVGIGAKGFIAFKNLSSELMLAIRSIHSGSFYFSFKKSNAYNS